MSTTKPKRDQHGDRKAAGANGLPAELFKTRADELVTCLHHLINTIWLKECIHYDWNLIVLCPVLKKGDSSMHQLSLGEPFSYRIEGPSSVLCERLKPVLANLISLYQGAFKSGKSTPDQIFTLRQILEKTQEMQIDTYHLFICIRLSDTTETIRCFG